MTHHYHRCYECGADIGPCICSKPRLYLQCRTCAEESGDYEEHSQDEEE
jgi:hypothetical protein